MARCLISFGANIGNPLKTILSAADQLQRKLGCTPKCFQLSRCFRTPPIGGPSGQPPFVNAVAAVTTACSPWEVWDAIRQLEHDLGRERNQRWEARRIDLDILLYEEQTIWTPHLKIPHPRMCMRRFILIPALDVAPHWIDPVSGWTIEQLAANVREGAGSFVLIADPASRAPSLLAEVARRTGASWQSSTTNNPSEKLTGRWLSLIESDENFSLPSLLSELQIAGADLKWKPKLTIVLAPTTAFDGAWEDIHLSIANQLNLKPNLQPPTFYGPRYLLAADDNAWATEEMIAAIEAMDCPVESI